MKKSNPFAHFFLLLVILIPYSLMLVNFDTKVAESATNEQTLVDKDTLKVTSSYQIDTLKMTIDWSLTYESQATTDTNQLLKIKFDNDSYHFEDHSSNWQQENTGWWSQEQFSEASQGVIRFSTPFSESRLFVSLQLDQKQVVEEGEEVVQEAVLTAAEEGPHELIAEVPANESSSQTSSSSSKASPERSSEAESNQASTAPASNTSSTSSVAATEQSTEPFIGPVRFQRTQGVPQARDARGTDPFAYTVNGDVKYPTHGTHTFLGGGATEDLFIKNYRYGVQASPQDVPQYLVTNSGFTDLDKGYHEYGNATTGQINTKKTVKYLEDKADGTKVFEVTVDTIGDAIRPSPKVDVVLLIDKSGSMRWATTPGNTRWSDLKKAVATFLGGVNQGEMDIGFALVSFYSPSVAADSQDHESNIGVWSGKTSNSGASSFADYGYDDYFTDDPSLLNNSTILAERAYEDTGTPTFLGVDSALHVMSKARPDATKVLCTITDGRPTLYPISSYYQNGGRSLTLDESLNKLYGSIATSSRPDFNRLYTGTGVPNVPNQANGNGYTDYSTETGYFLDARLPQIPSDYKMYSVGYHINTEANSIVARLGRDGTFPVTNVDGLVDALSQALYPYVSTINNATLTDPMSKFVDLDPDSILLTPITVNENGVLDVKTADSNGNVLGVKKEVTNTAIKLSNMNLGKVVVGTENGTSQLCRNGVRLTYKVTLKPEYRDGNFYPANETTYLLNGNNEEYFYAIPSIRDGNLPVDTVDVELTKIIKGTQEGLAGVQFGLFTAKTGGSAHYESNVTSEDGKLKFSEVEPGVYWLREITTPPGYQAFTPVQVTIDAQGGVTGLSTFPNIENEWKPIDFTIFKKDEAGKEALPGATFGLYDVNPENLGATPIEEGTSDQANGKITFTTRLLPGKTYYLKELKAPEGYIKQSGIYRIEVAADGSLKITYDGKAIADNELEYIIPANAENNQLHLEVKNTSITPLPRTGGAGRMASYLLLVVLLVGLSLYYVRSRQDTSQKGGV